MFKDFYFTQKRRLLSRIVKRKVNISDVTLLSQNCVGGVIYHDANQKFCHQQLTYIFCRKILLSLLIILIII